MDDRSDDNVRRRDFLYIAVGGMGVVGAASLAWPFIDQMNPDASARAELFVVDRPSLQEGQSAKINWLGKPLIIRRRTSDEIEDARAVSLDDLRDRKARNANLASNASATDLNRTVEGREDWIVLIGICTYWRGCIPIGELGDYGGWFCPCCGSHYDTAGRVRKGIARENLTIPKFRLLSGDKIVIG